MKRVIYSVYKDIGSDVFEEYLDKLIENKKAYAERIGADWKLFTNLPNDYVSLNNFKIEMFESLAEEYDEVLYLDMDVCVNTDDNIFTSINLNDGIAFITMNDDIFKPMQNGWEITHRSPAVKWKIASTLYGKDDVDVINTGVLIGKSEHIKEINYSKLLPDITHAIQYMEWPDQYVDHITPNNEAIFSYLIKENEVPFQYLPEEWHSIKDRRDGKDGKFIHYINKCFWDFFKDKTSCVYSMYVQIPDDKIDNSGNYNNDTIDKGLRTKLKMEEYYDRLLNNHKEYASKIGSEYKHYTYDDEYVEFRDLCLSIIPDMSEYNVINFYKIWILEKLSQEYDFVLYLDFDVCINTDINFFNTNNIYTNVAVYHDADMNRIRRCWKNPQVEINFRSPEAKYWNTNAMLMEEFITLRHTVPNTGIIGASRNSMSKLKYFEDFEYTLTMMRDLKEDPDSAFPSHVQRSFGYDNETVFGYKMYKEEVPIIDIEGDWYGWHAMINEEFDIDQHDEIKNTSLANKKKDRLANGKFIHFINKKFELFFSGSDLP